MKVMQRANPISAKTLLPHFLSGKNYHSGLITAENKIK
jgi:hypothetical protein